MAHAVIAKVMCHPIKIIEKVVINIEYDGRKKEQKRCF
jgi:hypothetical protein